MTHFLDLKYPIVQAPTGTIAREDLAVAVSNAGGLGAMGLTWDTPESAYDRVKAVAGKVGENLFYVNYVLHFEPTSLEASLKAGAPIVQFSYGIPSESVIKSIKDHDARFGIQVTNRESAARALEVAPDYLVCQGLEAGGHVQARLSLTEALAEVLQVSNGTPVLASGGIGDGEAIWSVVNQGASAAVLGSRFVATRESQAHDEYKEALVAAKSNDAVYSICFSDGWDNAPHRVLSNETYRRWVAEGCPARGSRPNEGDIMARNIATGAEIKRYDRSAPNLHLQGRATEMAMYAGTGVDRIKDIPSAGELVIRLGQEYEACRQEGE